MKACTTCGNEIGDRVWKCPYCEEVQTGPPPEPAKLSAVPSINLKVGLPTVDGALRKLKRELQDAKSDRRRLVRVIHGYGSTGVGGEIRVAVRKQLRTMLAAKKIQSFLAGEDYSDSTIAGEALLARHLGLRNSLRTDSRNPGITFVEL